MGIQKGNNFKNRYDTKNYSINQFKIEISEFFKFNQELIKKTIIETLKIINEVEKKFKLNLEFSSLLIVYDDIKNNENIDINLIDFAFFGDNNKINIDNDFTSSMKKFVFILEELQQKIDKNNYLERE